jgi:ABC-type tungstate transport system substrate-binding protein
MFIIGKLYSQSCTWSTPAPTASVVDATCTVATGTITVTAPLGAQYTYSIDGTNFQSSPTFNNVAPNTYTLTVQDAGGCSSSASYTVNPAPAAPPAPTATVVDATCVVATGTITVTAPIGAQYTYSIDGTNFQSSPTFNNVAPNTYTVTVLAGGCSSSASYTVNPAPGAPPAPTASVVDATCAVATGTITVTAPLGAQYTYSINGTNFQSSPTFNNVAPTLIR